jgi:hypothetical protein
MKRSGFFFFFLLGLTSTIGRADVSRQLWRIMDRVASLRLVPDGEGTWRHVGLETDHRRKCHQRVRARMILSGGDIFTVDSSLPDELIDGWIKANRASKRRRRRAESAALPETNRARVRLSDCEISRFGSTSSDDQSGRRHKGIGGLWW